MFTPATTPDDRGRQVDLIKPGQLTRSQTDLVIGPELAKFLKRVTKAESQRFDASRVSLGILGVILVLLAVSIFNWNRRGAPPILGSIIFWGGLVTIGILLRAFTRRKHGFTLASTAVSLGVCGSCGYSLNHIAPEADGCIVCPECGAAWKNFRISRPYWTATNRERLYRLPWWARALGLIPRELQLLSRDARGAYFRIMDKRLRLLPPARRAELGPDFIDQLRRRACWIGLGWRWLVALFPLAITCGLIYGMFTVAIDNEPERWIAVAIIGFFALVFGGLTAAAVRGHSFCPGDKRGRAWAEMGLCGCCGRTLPKDRPAGDGCTACSGCGAAWRVPGTSGGVSCVACGYALAGLPVDAEGRLRCPECGESTIAPHPATAATA